MSFEKKLPGFGRPFSLGQLYDCRSDTVLSGECLWDAQTIQNVMESSVINDSNHRIFVDETKEDKMSNLGIDEYLMLSIQSGLVPLVGSASYLKDKCSSPNLPKVTLKYECSTKCDKLNMEILKTEKVSRPDVFVKGIGTHVVSGILYGGQALFVFDNFSSSKSESSGHSLLEAVQYLPSVSCEGGKPFLSKELEEGSSGVRCNVYSDFSIPDKLTYKEAVLLFSTFSHSIVGSGNIALPIEITLFPLERLDPLAAQVMQTVDNSIADQLGISLSHLDQVTADCQDMLNLPIVQKCLATKREILEFGKTITTYKQLIQKQIKSALIRYRSGSVSTRALITILEEKENSPFAKPKLEVWMKLRDVQIQILSREDSMTGRQSGQGNVVPLKKKRQIIRLNVNIRGKHYLTMPAKTYLRQLQRGRLLKFPSADDDRQSSNIDQEYNLSTAQLFKNFVDANQLDTGLSFSFVESTKDDMKPAMYVSVIKDDVLLHDVYQLSIAPTGLKLKRALHDRLQIEWSGSNHFGRYEVQYEEINGVEKKTIHIGDQTSGNVFELTDLKFGSSYEIQVRAVCEIGHSAWSPIFTFRTLLATAPGKPTAKYEVSCDVFVQWQKPSHIAPNAFSNGYIITVNNITTDEKFEVGVDSKRRECFTFTNLETTSTYTFSVRAVFTEGQTDDGEISDKLEPTPTTLMKVEITQSSTLTKSTNPFIYQLGIQQTHTNEKDKIEKCELGERQLGQTEKVIMVVGATGAGKTTLINGLVNYVIGVNWKDNFRFQLIADNEGANPISQADSQTRWITSYTLHHHKGFTVPYTLTVIDTPGFGDTGGIMRDKEITTQMRNFFTTKGNEGIDHIDAIGFVTQASLARLTPTQQFIFDHVLSLFGRDISDNIFLLVTFADGQKPPVLEGIKVAKIPYKKSFKFNNSALYGEKQERDMMSSKPYSHVYDRDGEERGFDQMFWKMGENSFQWFFKNLGSTEPKSLQLTKDVLHERLSLETHVAGIQLNIRTGLNKLEQLKVEVDVLQKHQTDIDKNKDFTYTVSEETVETENIPSGTYITNCLQCNFTCHYPCYIPNDEDKSRCAAMNKQAGVCTVCPSLCVWSVHKNMTYRFLIESVEKTKTSDDLKARYEDASGKRLSAEQLIKKVVDDFYEVQMDVLTRTDEVRKSLNRLKTIALKPNPLSTVEYIDILIISEQAQKSPGWKNRIQQLEKVKMEAETLQQLAKPGYDPFQDYKKKHFDLKKKEVNELPILETVRKLLKREGVQKSTGRTNRKQKLENVSKEAETPQQLAKPRCDPFQDYKREDFDLKKKEVNEQPILDTVRKLLKREGVQKSAGRKNRIQQLDKVEKEAETPQLAKPEYDPLGALSLQ